MAPRDRSTETPDTTPPPAPRPPTLKELAQLVDGQRRDFDQLGEVLNVKDIERTSERRADQTVLNTAIEQLNRTTQVVARLNGQVAEMSARLGFYEQYVLPLRKGRKSFDAYEKRRLALSKEAAARAVADGGGENQTDWPMGPAPTRACPAAEGEEHRWQLLGLFEHVSPPVPTFGCTGCKWTWTRGWTQAEFTAWLARQPQETRKALAEQHFPESPPYAASEHAEDSAEPPPDDERLQIHRDLVADGVSDAVARATAWPEDDPPAADPAG